MRKAIVTQLICLWGIVSFLALCTECSSMAADLAVKIPALASLLACLAVGRRFDRKHPRDGAKIEEAADVNASLGRL